MEPEMETLNMTITRARENGKIGRVGNKSGGGDKKGNGRGQKCNAKCINVDKDEFFYQLET